MAHTSTAAAAPQLDAAAGRRAVRAGRRDDRRGEPAGGAAGHRGPRRPRPTTRPRRCCVECLQALERSRPVAVARLRRLWQDAAGDAAGGGGGLRAPRSRARRPARRPAGRPRRARAARARHPPGRAPRDPRRGRDQRGAQRDPLLRRGRRPRRDRRPHRRRARRPHLPEWVDDDLAAMAPRHGALCVSCWIERPTAEQRRLDDDGLCADCRDAGRPGVPAPAEATRAGRLRARITHIAEGAATRDAGPLAAARRVPPRPRRRQGRDRRLGRRPPPRPEQPPGPRAPARGPSLRARPRPLGTCQRPPHGCPGPGA